MADDSGAAEEKLRLHLLVLRCQTGDEGAFAALFHELGPRTLRYLQGLVGDAADDVHGGGIEHRWRILAVPVGEPSRDPIAACDPGRYLARPSRGAERRD